MFEIKILENMTCSQGSLPFLLGLVEVTDQAAAGFFPQKSERVDSLGALQDMVALFIAQKTGCHSLEDFGVMQITMQIRMQTN